MSVIFDLFDGTGPFDPATAPSATESRAGIVGPVAGVTYNNRTKFTKRMTDGANTSNPTQYQSDSGGPTGFAPVRHAYFKDPTSPSGWAWRLRSNVSGGESGNRYQMGLGMPTLSVPTSGVIERWETQVMRWNNFKLAEIGPSNAGHFALFGFSHRFTNGLNGPYLNTDMGVPVGHHYININLTGGVISNQGAATGYKDLGPVQLGVKRKLEWRIGWSRTSAGYLFVYFDDLLVHEYHGTTVYSGGANIEYRTGSYYGSAYTTAPEMEVLHLAIATTRTEAAPAAAGTGGGGGVPVDPPPVTPPATTVAMRSINDQMDSAATSIFTSFSPTGTVYTGGSLQLNATQASKVAQAASDPKYVANADGLTFSVIAWPDKSSGAIGTHEARTAVDFGGGDRFVFRRTKVWGTALTGVTGVTSTDVLTKTAHGLVAGDTVTFSGFSGGANLVQGQMYYVTGVNLTANTFQVTATSGGATLDLGSDVAGATVTKFQDRFDMYVRDAEILGQRKVFDAPTAISGLDGFKLVWDADKRKVSVHGSNDTGATFTQDLGSVSFVNATTDKAASIALVSQIMDGDIVPSTFGASAVVGTTDVGIGGGTGAGVVGSDGMTFNRTQRLQFPPARTSLPFYWLILARRGTGTASTVLAGLTKDGTNAGRWLTWFHPSDTASGFAGQLRLSDAVGGATQAFGFAGPTATSKWTLILAGETSTKDVVIRWADVDPVPINSTDRFHGSDNAGTLGTGGAVTNAAAKFMIGDADFAVGATNFEGDMRMVAAVGAEPLSQTAFNALATSSFIVLRSAVAGLSGISSHKELADANAGSSATGTQVVDRVSTSFNEELASRAGTTTAYAGTDVPYDTAATGGTTPSPTGGPQVPDPSFAPTASADAVAGGVGSFTLTGILPAADAGVGFTPHASGIRFYYSDDGETLLPVAGWQSGATVSVTSVPLDVDRRYYYRWRNNAATPIESDYSPALLHTINTPGTASLTNPAGVVALQGNGGTLDVYWDPNPVDQAVDRYDVKYAEAVTANPADTVFPATPFYEGPGTLVVGGTYDGKLRAPQVTGLDDVKAYDVSVDARRGS